MSLRRMLPFIVINVIVSAVVMLVILNLWGGRVAAPGADAVTPATAASTTVALGATAEPTLAGQGQATAVSGDEDLLPIHIVAAGETLGLISQQYDVSVEDIAAANGITDINSLTVGQQLVIPILGVATATALPPTASPTSAAPPTPLPTEPPPQGEAIVEIVEVIGVGDLAGEAVRITNAGTRPVALLDWELFDQDGNIYRFVAATLFGSSDSGSPSILVHTEAGTNSPSDLYWGRETAVWEAGETVTLRDAEGTVQATFEIP